MGCCHGLVVLVLMSVMVLSLCFDFVLTFFALGHLGSRMLRQNSLASSSLHAVLLPLPLKASPPPYYLFIQNQMPETGLEPCVVGLDLREKFCDLPSEPRAEVPFRVIYTLDEDLDEDGEARFSIFPGGRTGSSSGKGLISLCMNVRKRLASRITGSFVLTNSTGTVIREVEFQKLEDKSTASMTYFGVDDFIERSKVLDEGYGILIDGKLSSLTAVIQCSEKLKSFYLPSNPFAKNMLALFESGKHTDISFDIAGTLIKAHKVVIIANAPILANLFADGQETSTSIKGISPDVFRCVLKYIYGGNGPDECTALKWGKELVDFANRYDIAGLKMEVEAQMVASRVIKNIDDCVEYLLFADAMSCALLKEYAIAYYVERRKNMINAESYQKLASSASLLRDLALVTEERNRENRQHREYLRALLDQSTSNPPPPPFFYRNPDDINKMPINQLRKRLGEKGLDVDGTREMLLSRLQDDSGNGNSSSSSSSDGSSDSESSRDGYDY